MRVAQARVLVAEGEALAAVARVMQISRQALYRVPKPRTVPQRRAPAQGSVDAVIVEVAQANPTDGYRIVTAWVQRKLGRAVNRKRVLRVMREQKLIQRRAREPKRRRPGFFMVERPGQLWHLDMTSVWVAEHGWVYLNAIIDCCTREIVGWELSLRCRAKEAIVVIERAVTEQAIARGTLTMGTDNGSAFTARATRLVLSGLGVSHRRGAKRGCRLGGVGAPLASSHTAGDCGVGDSLRYRFGDVAVEHAGDDVVGVQLVLGDHAGDGVRGGELHLLVDRAGAHVQRALKTPGNASTLLIWLG